MPDNLATINFNLMHHDPVIDVRIFFQMLFDTVNIGIHEITADIDFVNTVFYTIFYVFIPGAGTSMQNQRHFGKLLDFL